MAVSYEQTAFTNGYEFTGGKGYELPQYPFVPPPEIASGQTGHHPIVIVGAGLAGLTLACGLAERGVPAVLLDEDNTVGVKGASSRGICYTQKSLEIFHRLGIYERIAAKGIQWSVGRTFAGDDEVYSFDLRQQSGYQLSSQPPFINIQQFYIEGYLVDRIGQLGHVDIRWNNRVTGFEQDAGAATLSVATPAGDYKIRAGHVIDTTGSRSPFREWVGASVTAKKGDDRWCIADVRFSSRPPVERHTWIEAPFNENRAVWQHLMGDDVWRIDYQMAPNADADEVSREDVVRERLARQFGADTEVEIVWVGPYAYRSECIDRMRHGRVFFMGDAAKVVSPFGARGGNTGIADADNLAWKLAAVHKGRAGPGLLDSYHEERHEAALQNVLVTNRTARFLRPAEGAEQLFRKAALGLARQYVFARQLVNTGRMAIANPYSRSTACDATGGKSVQNVSFHWIDGAAAGAPTVAAASLPVQAPGTAVPDVSVQGTAAPGVVNDLLRWADGRLLLLVFGDVTAAGLQRLQDLDRGARVRCVQVLGAEGEGHDALMRVRDPQGHLQGACHVFGHAWALIRPDSYVAAAGENIDAALVQAVDRALGATGTAGATGATGVTPPVAALP